MNNFFNVFLDKKGELMSLLLQHVELTLIAVTFSVLIGVPLGIIITKYKRAAKVTIGFANLIQAVPSLAILGFLIPFVGIGSTPAIVMVILYSILPILKNTYTALSNINPDTIEAAKGIGMTPKQILLKVKLPLAMPIIMAGVRIASVTAVGLMTIAAFIGAGGLGYLVFTGIQTADNNLILLGAIPAAILALVMDFIVGKIEDIVTPDGIKESKNKSSKKESKVKQRIVTVTALAVVLLIMLNYGIKSFAKGINSEGTITIASKNFIEQLILGNMMADLIESNTNIKVERKMNLGGTSVAFEALKKGSVDMYVDYTGTMLINVLGEQNTYESPDGVYNRAKEAYAEKFDIELLEPLGFNNTYVFAVRPEIKEEYNIDTISDLAKISDKFTAGTTIEFTNRDDGLPGVTKEYGLNFKNVKAVDNSLRYKALVEGETDITDAFSTDGLLKEFGLSTIKDDKNFFPPYYAVPIIRKDTLEKYPELKDVINILANQIDNEIMMELNYKVDVNNEDPAKVAKQFLIENGYID